MSEAVDSRAEEALRSVQQHPQAALALARAVLDGTAGRADAARAHWAAGLAHRELGDLDAARAEIERARALAARGGDDRMTARIMVSLALVHAFDGRIAEALDVLDVAEPLATGPDRAHLLMQRGIVLYWRGHLEESIAAYDGALGALADAADPLVEARLRVNYGAALSWLGRLDAAADHLHRAVDLATGLGQTLIAATAEHNRGHVEALRGDLPAAFAAFKAAEALYAAAGAGAQYVDNLHLDHARALLQANLLDEAVGMVRAVLRHAGDDHSRSVVGDAYYVAAQVGLAQGDMRATEQAAAASRDNYAASGRSAWAVLADGLAISARLLGPSVTDAREAATGAAEVLEAMGYKVEATRGLLVAARACERMGDVDGAEQLLAQVRRRSALTTALDRMVVAQVAAGCARRRGATAAARRHVRRGLRTFVENAAALGAIELRARAAANGEVLAAHGMALAVADGRPRELLEYVEVTRSTMSALQRVRPPQDPELAALLADLRRAAHELRESEPGPARAELERERTRIERRVRDHTWRERGGADMIAGTISEALASLDAHVLVEYGEAGGRLYAAVVIGTRATLHDLGDVAGLTEDVDACTFALHRLNRRRVSAESGRAARAALDELSARVVARVVPPRAQRGSAPLVVVPSGALNGFPWGAAVALTGRPISVAPSLLAWSAARATASMSRAADRVVLVAGPDLMTATAEVGALAALHPRARALTGAAATVARTAEEIDGARLVHFACHGTFRADSPMFSTLTLVDGPLTVYDLERVAELPPQFVLSACDVAASSVLRGGTLLGVSSALMAFGAASVIAPLTPVNDERVAAVVTDVHRALAAGAQPAVAIADTIAAADDGTRATAVAFVAMGA